MAHQPFSVSVECIALTFHDGKIKALLAHPSSKHLKGTWALPFAWLREHDEAEKTARRMISTLLPGSNASFYPGSYYDAAARASKERVIALSVLAFVRPDAVPASEDEPGLVWVPVKKLPDLPMDHKAIIKDALKGLRAKMSSEPFIFDMLPEKFTLSELQSGCELFSGKTLDKRNFRKKVLHMNILKPLKEKQSDVPHKAAFYYLFDRKKFKAAVETGTFFHF